MRFFNADGGEVESCGNATRCVARLLMDERGLSRVKLMSRGGMLICSDAGKGLVTVDVGVPKLEWNEIPLTEAVDTIKFPLPLEGTHIPAAAVLMGNPHCILFVDDAATAPVDQLGPRIERHPLFPNRINVEFAQVIDRSHIRMRVWERGIGVTLACGTGACATAGGGGAARPRRSQGRGAAGWRQAYRSNGAKRRSCADDRPASLAFAGEIDLDAIWPLTSSLSAAGSTPMTARRSRRAPARRNCTNAVVVNTCAVTAEAVRQSRQAIRKLKRERPTARIIVTGCAAQTEPETYAAMPEVDAVLGNQEKLDAPKPMPISGSAAWSGCGSMTS